MTKEEQAYLKKALERYASAKKQIMTKYTISGIADYEHAESHLRSILDIFKCTLVETATSMKIIKGDKTVCAEINI